MRKPSETAEGGRDPSVRKGDGTPIKGGVSEGDVGA